MTPSINGRGWPKPPRGGYTMTVCIGALCTDGQDSAIVLCSDGKASNALGSNDMTIKIRALNKSWYCLTAGGEDEITHLVRLIKAEMAKLSEINETNILPAIKEAVRARKEEKSDDICSSKWGMNFRDFRKERASFPDDDYRATMSTIERLEIEADLIVAGFVDKSFPYLIQVNNGGAIIRDDYAVSGEGAYLAQSVFLHRQHIEGRGLWRTLYTAYEAKRYAERVPSVGRRTMLAVLHPRGISFATAAGREVLEKKFQAFGPKDLDTSLADNQDVPAGVLDKRANE